MATRAQLKALRKKYGLGEFSSKKRKARRRSTKARSASGGAYGFNPPFQVGTGLLHRS